nr:RNA-directed DNA polymerase, eukaryota [Tanacetum cinerariifolium]
MREIWPFYGRRSNLELLLENLFCSRFLYSRVKVLKHDITPKYLGGLWVLLEFGKQESKKNFMDHSGVNSWFHLIQDVPLDFVSDERIAWVDIEGVPLQAWSRETFSKISNKWGELMSIEDTSVASFGRKRVSILTKYPTSILESFKIIVKGKVYVVRAKELFTLSPNFLGIKENLCSSDDESVSGGMHNSNHSFMSEEEGEFNPSDGDVPETIFGDNSASKKQMSEDPFGIYKIMKKNRPVGDSQTSPSLSHLPGFSPVIFGSHSSSDHAKVADKDPRINFQEASSDARFKADSLLIDAEVLNSPHVVRMKEFSTSRQKMWMIMVGSSGGILCIWEASIFKKDFVTVSDNFIAIYGTWISNNAKIIIVSIYAPQQPCHKRVLWDYLSLLIDRWNGEVILKGDFNEVRSKEERRRLVFNHAGARVFNQFISSSGLIDVKMEGYYFTWSHPSATKMSKLDRFLVSDGNVSDAILAKRCALIGQIHDIKKKEAADSFQKSKVRWTIEGDENSSFFHGLINKKRSQLAIRRIFVDGFWQQDPRVIKEVFHNHFASRFKRHTNSGPKINFSYPNRLSILQANHLERNVSHDEIRAAVWNCGNNKSLGPDGKHKKAMFFKVDFAKAYDSVRWDYLIDVLEAFGFGSRWCQWIRGTFSFAKASVLVNGSPSDEFNFHCGLKQGDPLAPLLFIIVMESLYLSFSKVVEAGLFIGLGRGGA